MVGVYEIHCGGRVAGTAKVSREGLYYRFDCRCQWEQKEVCKISVSYENARIILGTPVPENGIFVLRTRLPVKQFSGEEMHFCIADEIFIPVFPDKPFTHLKDIKHAVFAACNGQYGVVIKRKPDA